MALGAETAFILEGIKRIHSPKRKVMVNVEINDRCAFTKTCGDSCVLNQLGSGRRQELNAEIYYKFCHELALHGETVENVALVGKEPTETPDRLYRTLEILSSASVNTRPLNIGMITAGHRLPQVQSILMDYPLDWMAISIDTPETGLRNENQVIRSLGDAAITRESGGTNLLGVNTVMHPQNLGGLVSIGERVINESAIDQWALSPMFANDNGEIKSIIPISQLRELIARLISHFGDSPKPILVNLEYEEMIEIIGRESFLVDPLEFWRIEYPIKNTAIKLVSMNQTPGYFLRLKYSGGLLTRKEFRSGDFDGKSHGNYAPGRLANALRKMSLERNANVLTANTNS